MPLNHGIHEHGLHFAAHAMRLGHCKGRGRQPALCYLLTNVLRCVHRHAAEHMTRLFTKITNQMIRKCKQQIMYPGKLWDQDKLVLIANMQVIQGMVPAQGCERSWCLGLRCSQVLWSLDRVLLGFV